MCGIVAYQGPEGSNWMCVVGALAERLHHRGPDGRGVHGSTPAVLAHTRLSIIDVEGGHQPLVSRDGRLALVANGEIYNQGRLRSRLAPRHQFQTRSDSEVILHLYEDLGPDCVREIDGMFAFVLADGDHLLAARDPLGIKPLYMGRDDDDGLWFASEIKALVDVCRKDIREFPPGTLYTDTGGFQSWFQPTWDRIPATNGNAGRDVDRDMTDADRIAPVLEAQEAKPNPWAEIRGVNYIPSYAASSHQIWSQYDAKTLRRELSAARGLGFNSVRFWLNYDAFAEQPDEFLTHFADFVDICRKLELTVMPILFDGAGAQATERAGRWGEPEGHGKEALAAQEETEPIVRSSKP